MTKNKKSIEKKQLDLINEIGLHTLILKEGLFTPFLKKLFTGKVERAMRKASRDPHMKDLIKKFNSAMINGRIRLDSRSIYILFRSI